MKNSNSYTHRQSFAGMVQSILADFLDPENSKNLIEKVLLKYFVKDIQELS